MAIPSFKDERGLFQKLYRRDVFEAQGIDWQIREEFVSVSAKGVLRGMHFQKAPFAHHKLVSCYAGRVLDVVLDMRAGSETFGKTYSQELGDTITGLILPEGVAHGFYALEDSSIVHYQTSCEYVPEADSGVHWDSFGFKWPCADPDLSGRDEKHPKWNPEETPFK